MGEVWSAEHLALNTEVAVKFLSTDAGGAARQLALHRFRFEAQVSAHLGQKTSHVVSVHDAGNSAQGPYLVMEHVRGCTLRVELNRRGQLDATVVADILDQVAEALSIAHAFGIVHRDLKPSNLLLADHADQPIYVKVADFGIAKALHASPGVDRPEDTSDGWMLGSPAYMSPEQMSGRAVDARTDMWSLGVIAYESLTGRLPFPGRTVSEILLNMSVGRFEAPSRVLPSLPKELDEWFLRALAQRKENRFRTMAEMTREFRRASLARPRRRYEGTMRSLAVATGLTAALLILRPSPSEALSEVVESALPAALAVSTAPPSAPPSPPAMAAGASPASLANPDAADASVARPPGSARPAVRAAPPASVRPKPRVFTEVF